MASDTSWLTPRACRAARALLNWTQDDLAGASSMSRRTINAFEMKRHDQAALSKLNNRALVATFERFGVHFLTEEKNGRRIVTGLHTHLEASSPAVAAEGPDDVFGQLVSEIERREHASEGDPSTVELAHRLVGQFRQAKRAVKDHMILSVATAGERVGFDALLRKVELGLCDYLRDRLGPLYPSLPPARTGAFTLSSVASATFEVIGQLANLFESGRVPFRPAAELQLLRFAVVVLVAAITPRAGPKRVAPRLRKMRPPPRRGVLKQIRINISPQDIEILRQVGLLISRLPSEEALQIAVEAFLLESFLTRFEIGPWPERYSQQRSRIDLLRHAATSVERNLRSE